MGFLGALSAGNLNTLRGVGAANPGWWGTQYMALCPNTTIFAAQVDSIPGDPTIAQIDVKNVTTGVYGDIVVGMRILLSKTNNRRAAYFDGRVRGIPGSPTVAINETSADIEVDDFVFIIDDYPILPKLGRVAANGTYFKDYNFAYRTTGPVETGLASAYADFVDSGTGVLELSLSASGLAIADGATISSFLWIVDDGTITVGTDTDQNITVTFPPGFRWVRLFITDSNGVTQAFKFPVWAFETGTFDPATGFTGATIRGSVEAGYSADVGAFDGVSDLLDKTLCCVFTINYYNEAQTDINGKIDFVGRIRVEDTEGRGDEVLAIVKDNTRFQLEGPLDQAARQHCDEIVIVNDATPTVWDELADATLWRGIGYTANEDSTFSNLHAMAFEDTSEDYEFEITQRVAGNLLGAINELAGAVVGTHIEQAPDGKTQVVREASYLDDADKNALTTVANFDTRDYLALSLTYKHVPEVGKVEGAGGAFYPASVFTHPVLSIAPGTAQGEATGAVSLNNQILTAGTTTPQAELNTRIGRHMGRLNARWSMRVELPDGYHFLVPSTNQWYTWTIDTDTSNRGWEFTTSSRWMLIEIEHSHDNETGRRAVNATFLLEPGGESGLGVNFPDPLANLAFGLYPTLPNFPFFNPRIGTIHPNANDQLPLRQLTPGAPGVGSGTWSQSYDLTASDGGWSAFAWGGCTATWTSGVGWQTCLNILHQMGLERAFSRVQIDTIDFTITTADLSDDVTFTYFYSDGSSDTDTVAISGDGTYTSTNPNQSKSIIEINITITHDNQTTMTNITFYGPGANPLV